uniref:Queuosine salvage protein n=1 Tax=Rhabditophanes sp. KR3021 TaxID=114890 RepID=A0AC35U3W6_9BILA
MLVLTSEEILTPRESGKFVAEHKVKSTFIKEEGVEKVSDLIFEALKSGEMGKVDWDNHPLHPRNGDEEAINFVFFMDVINFSFWTDAERQYTTTLDGQTYTAYFAAAAAVNRALRNNIPITSAQFMANITVDQMKDLFRSDSYGTIPLVSERVDVLNEAGKVLLEKFNGSFYNVLKQCNKSAVALLELIVTNFKSFKDYSVYEQQVVALLKRAQILVADCYGCLKGKNEIGNFADIGELTMFADYRVPQVLYFFGALEHDEEVMVRLQNDYEFMNNEPMEVCLRACSIHAVELIITSVIKKLRKAKRRKEVIRDQRRVTAMDVDIFLWLYRREHAAEIEATVKPHRVRCIYY